MTARGDGYRTDIRVVHVSDETHAAAKAFCAEHNIDMAPWVSGLIEEFEDRRDGPPPARLLRRESVTQEWIAGTWRKPPKRHRRAEDEPSFDELLAEHGSGVRE